MPPQSLVNPTLTYLFQQLFTTSGTATYLKHVQHHNQKQQLLFVVTKHYSRYSNEFLLGQIIILNQTPLFWHFSGLRNRSQKHKWKINASLNKPSRNCNAAQNIFKFPGEWIYLSPYYISKHVKAMIDSCKNREAYSQN